MIEKFFDAETSTTVHTNSKESQTQLVVFFFQKQDSDVREQSGRGFLMRLRSSHVTISCDVIGQIEYSPIPVDKKSFHNSKIIFFSFFLRFLKIFREIGE